MSPTSAEDLDALDVDSLSKHLSTCHIDPPIEQLINTYYSDACVDLRQGSFRPLECTSVAPSLGTLTKTAPNQLHKSCRKSIIATAYIIENDLRQKRTWAQILHTLQRAPYLRTCTLGESSDDRPRRHDKFYIVRHWNGTLYRETHGYSRKQRPICEQLRDWFAGLVGDDDVVRETPIDWDKLATTAVSLGRVSKLRIYSPELLDTISHQRISVLNVPEFGLCFTAPLVDICVLRYPGPDHPYFKLYRVAIVASSWRSDNRRLSWRGRSNVELNGYISSYALTTTL